MKRGCIWWLLYMPYLTSDNCGVHRRESKALRVIPMMLQQTDSRRLTATCTTVTDWNAQDTDLYDGCNDRDKNSVFYQERLDNTQNIASLSAGQNAEYQFPTLPPDVELHTFQPNFVEANKDNSALEESWRYCTTIYHEQ